MIPAGVVLDELCDQMNHPRGLEDETYKTQVRRKLNEAYREIVCGWPWNGFKKTTTLSDSTYIVPADCRLIVKVMDSDEHIYNMVAGLNRLSPFNYNWYFNTPVATVLASGITLAVSEYSKSVTSTAEFPATTCVGEYIRIGSNAGLYHIATWTSASAITLTDYYRGDAVANGIFSIRPLGTYILGFADAGGDSYTASEVDVTYLRYPLPLYKDEDIIELPGSCSAVTIRALQKLLAMQGFNQPAERMGTTYLAALAEMKANEPQDLMIRPTTMFSTSQRTREMASYIRGLSLINS